MKSVFLSNLHHAYARTDGTYAFPNSREGDMLKQAKTELERLFEGINKLRAVIRETEEKHRQACLNAGISPQVALQAQVDTLRHVFALVTDTAVGGMHFNTIISNAAPKQEDNRSCNNCRNNHTGDCDDCTPSSSHWEKETVQE